MVPNIQGSDKPWGWDPLVLSLRNQNVGSLHSCGRCGPYLVGPSQVLQKKRAKDLPKTSGLLSDWVERSKASCHVTMLGIDIGLIMGPANALQYLAVVHPPSG